MLNDPKTLKRLRTNLWGKQHWAKMIQIQKNIAYYGEEVFKKTIEHERYVYRPKENISNDLVEESVDIYGRYKNICNLISYHTRTGVEVPNELKNIKVFVK